ncbi:MAG: glycosyltransferase [Xanthobacteraceae bacterium]
MLRTPHPDPEPDLGKTSRIPDARRPRISIVIKALNEERNIAAAIESAIVALAGLEGEIILADCLSTDRTVAIAREYPVAIVRLERADDRSCGAGAQLGYQYSRGEFICLVDGDMRLCEGFVAAAIRCLEENPRVAGVGGLIIECEKENLEFVKRRESGDPNQKPGVVKRLDCGGLYRRAAIETVGYLADRNLHGAEELELGARLNAHGWTLVRIDRAGIEHDGHAGSAYRLLLRRLTSGMALASGEVLRGTIGRPHFRFVVQGSRSFAVGIAVQLWWLCLLSIPFLGLGRLSAALCELATLIAPFAFMSLRCGSIRMGLYSVAAWNVCAVAMWPGFLRRRIPPTEWIKSRALQQAPSLTPSVVGVPLVSLDGLDGRSRRRLS